MKIKLWSEQDNKFIDYDHPGLICTFDENGILIFGYYNENEDYYDLKPLRFTGLKDKNGIEIYEDDILDFDSDEWNSSLTHISNWEFPMWQVIWDEKNGCWDTGGGTTSECSTYKSVIGNIYQNCELLKDEKK